MTIVESITVFKNNLHHYLNMVNAGEELTIKRGNVPIARVVPYDKFSKPWEPGGLEGKIQYLPDDPELQKEIEDMFYGEDAFK